MTKLVAVLLLVAGCAALQEQTRGYLSTPKAPEDLTPEDLTPEDLTLYNDHHDCPLPDPEDYGRAVVCPKCGRYALWL